MSYHHSDAFYPIFVYGTLRRGGKNYGLLRHRTLTEQPAYVDGMDLYSLGPYPMMIHGTGVVFGELLYIPPFLYDEVLNDLDRLEGYQPEQHAESLYRRILIEVMTVAFSEPVSAWAYIGDSLMIEPNDPYIESGDWLEYRRVILQNTRFGRFYE